MVMDSFPRFKNLVDMAAQRAQQKSQQVVSTFLTDNGQVDGEISFSGLDQAAKKIAMGLQQKGLKGRNLLLLYTPGLDYIRAFFGCLYAGCVPVPAYPPVGSKDLVRLQKIAVDCQAGAILSSSILGPVIESWVSNVSNGLDLTCIATDTFDAFDSSGFVPYDPEPDEVAFLQYTSGSTGHPKGVMVSHGNLLANFEQIVRGFVCGDDFETSFKDFNIVIWLPPFHDMGLIGGVLTPIYAGAHVTLMSPLTFLKRPYLWLKAISDTKAQVTGGPNFAYQYCVRKISQEQSESLDLSSLEVAFNGAEPIQVEALRGFADRFSENGFDKKAFLPCYGLAEATLFVAGSPPMRGARVLKARLDKLEQGKFSQAPANDPNPRNETGLVSSGVLAKDTCVRIVNHQTAQACADGEIGEIWINSPSVAQGYWDKPNFSKSVFGVTIRGDDSGMTFMRSGDLGFLWQDELYVTGRIKEMIIASGRNHYPQDIEQSLQEANPTFRQGCGAAFSVVEDGKEQLVIMQEVSRAAGNQADYQKLALVGVQAVAARHGLTPKALVLIPQSSLPKTSSGKIQRAEAKQMFVAGNFAPVFLYEPGTARSNASVARESTQEVSPQAGRDATDSAEFTDWRSDLYAEMQSWVADKLDVEPHHIDLDVTFSELGVDSVEAVDLVDRLQDRIERTIPAIEMLRYPTVKALILHFADELEQQQRVKQQSEEQQEEDVAKLII